MSPTAVEQEILELINRTRMDPAGETLRLVELALSDTDVSRAVEFFNVDLDLFQQQMAAYSPVSPLAWNSALGQAAKTHSQLMIDFDEQSHQLPGELDLGDRVLLAGYDFRTVGENVFAFGQNAVESHAAFVIDWGYGPGGIQSPAGHRVSILNGNFTEAGIGAIAETNPATQVGPLVVTHNLGADRDSSPYLLGVVFEDQDEDDFYDAGEGLSGVTVSATGSGGTFTTTSWVAGGYQMLVPNGNYTVTFSGGGLSVPIIKTVAVSGANEKLDALLEEATGATVGNDLLAMALDGGKINFQAGFDIALIETAFGPISGVSPETSGTVGVNYEPSTNTATVSSGGHTTVAVNVERLVFTDYAVAFDTNGDAGKAYRLYEAIFDRTPDLPGLGYWIDFLDRPGTNFIEAAGYMIQDVEFTQLYGPIESLTDEEFLTKVYENILDRAPDPAGYQFWLDQLIGGQSKGEVIAYISEDVENTDNTAPQIVGGILYDIWDGGA